MNRDILTEEERQIITEAGFGKECGIRGKAALLVIDAQEKFIGPNVPTLEAIKTSRLAIGSKAWKALREIRRVLALSREKNIPVIFTRALAHKKASDNNPFLKKTDPNMNSIPESASDIVLPVEEKDIVIDKVCPSAFFETELDEVIKRLNIQSVIVTGFVTSGCVRATVIDAFSRGLNVVIPEECVQDRLPTIHEMTLVDLDLKYADVISTKALLEMLSNSIV